MDRRLGVALVLGLAMITVGANQALAEHGAGETFAQVTVGEAPEPTTGTQGPLADDRLNPLVAERTVTTFEVPDRFDAFYLYVTEIHVETASVEVWEDIDAEHPSGQEVHVWNSGGNTVGVRFCEPPGAGCSWHYHPPTFRPETSEALDGTYEVTFNGLSTASYEVTAYGFPS